MPIQVSVYVQLGVMALWCCMEQGNHATERSTVTLTNVSQMDSLNLTPLCGST